MPKNRKKTASSSMAQTTEKTVGRQWFDGKDPVDVLSKCKAAWAIGCPDTEAAAYAEISIASLNRWLADHPEDKDLRDRLKEKPIMKARQTIVGALEDPAHAWRYIEHKRPEEFKNRAVPTIGEVNISFTQELKNRVTKYEPEPIDITPSLPTSNTVGMVEGLGGSIGQQAERAGLHQGNPAA